MDLIIPARGVEGEQVRALAAVPFDPDKQEVRHARPRLRRRWTRGRRHRAARFFARGMPVCVTGGPQGLPAIQWLDSAGKAPPLSAKPDCTTGEVIARGQLIAGSCC
jgi:hypothetical protein